MEVNHKGLENQYIYPSTRRSKLILASPGSPTMSNPLLLSPRDWGKRRIDEVKINEIICLFTNSGSTYIKLYGNKS
jgi:hypothetical protein